ncbi:RING-H2 finger protein ATL33-like [Gastrolobium bilobum]|uniref:RING-H2 finger protein ATL33-like n=1 Tax=Gastrolobium bilobum TaxID=150636 RepID=UPI002AB1167D|nr:RING-H2 finger protein ATL33-like [Gastrolobium bilobum]
MLIFTLTSSITMQNSSTTISAPPPLPLPLPPNSAAPPPPPFASSPNSVFQITVLPAPPPPPLFADTPSSVDLSPLKFLLALVAIVTIPALIYTFIFAFRCPASRRRHHSAGETSGDPSFVSELSHQDVENAGAGSVADLKYQKETHAKEIGGECPVCLAAFADGEEVRQLSACKHSFHASCIDMWLSNHSNCPICRATIAPTAKNRSSSGDLQQGHRDASAAV